MKRFMFCVLCMVVFVFTVGAQLSASELLYEPVNPSFGGSPLNGQWMLSQAQIQDPYGFLKDPARTPTAPTQDLMSDFKNALARQIFAKLSTKIIGSAFGEDGTLQDGHYDVGDYTIDVTSDVSGINVVMTNKTNGNITTVEVPYY